eukprot:Phypoly_transcript_01532.p1 GENE.Phypoly_transcript_01532~~Phypoly_transcript_01532.p1  ORF type:complete len:684 (+),score=66.63 Phypoly_transcript_01532:637-2688(+)
MKTSLIFCLFLFASSWAATPINARVGTISTVVPESLFHDGIGTDVGMLGMNNMWTLNGDLYWTESGFGVRQRSVDVTTLQVTTHYAKIHDPNYIYGYVYTFNPNSYNSEVKRVYDDAGNAYSANGCCIMKSGLQGDTAFAGTCGNCGYYDGLPLTGLMQYVSDLIIYQGALYVAHQGYIRFVNLNTGELFTAVGSNPSSTVMIDGPAASAKVSSPYNFIVQGSTLYFSDSNSTSNFFRSLQNSVVTTSTLPVGGAQYFDTAGNIWVAKTLGNPYYLNAYKTVLRYSPSGVLQVNISAPYPIFVGQLGRSGYGINGIPQNVDGAQNVAVFANINTYGVVGDDLYIADIINGVIRKVTFSGNSWTVATILGKPKMIDGPIATATLANPAVLQKDGQGNIYIYDSGLPDANSQALEPSIKQLTSDGHIFTIAGYNASSTIFPKIITDEGCYYSGLAVDLDGTVYTTSGSLTSDLFYSLKVYKITGYSKDTFGTETFIAGNNYTSEVQPGCRVEGQGTAAQFCLRSRYTFDPRTKTLYMGEENLVKKLNVVNAYASIYLDENTNYLDYFPAFDADTGRLWIVDPFGTTYYWNDPQNTTARRDIGFTAPGRGLCAGAGFLFVSDKYSGKMYAIKPLNTSICYLQIAGPDSQDPNTYAVTSDGPRGGGEKPSFLSFAPPFFLLYFLFPF